MKRLATLVFLMLAASMGAAPVGVRGNGFPHQMDTWVAASTSGATANGTNAGSSCTDPGFVADGTDDNVEIGYAFQDVLAGGTVHICAGAYYLTGDIVHNDAVTVVGAGMTRTFLIGSAIFNEDGTSGGGVEHAFLFGEDMIMRGMTIRGFWSDYGAVYGGSLVASHMRFDHNINPVNDGGAVWVGDVTVRNSIFTDNNSAANGGAISAGGRIVAIRTRFARNTTAVNGGAIDFQDGPTKSRIVDCTFKKNRALNQGGALFAETYSTVTIRRSTFARNRSVSHGGAARFYESAVRVVNSRFERNRATEAGGAVDAYHGTLSVVGSTFLRNRSTTGGGAIVSWQQFRLTMRHSTFIMNRTGVAGGAFLCDCISAKVFNSTFLQNHAHLEGGAFSMLGGLQQEVRGNAFTNNSSPNGGTLHLYTCGGSVGHAQVRRFKRLNSYAGNHSRGEHPQIFFDTAHCA